MVCHFDTFSDCDRRTDGQTDISTTTKTALVRTKRVGLLRSQNNALAVN